MPPHNHSYARLAFVGLITAYAACASLPSTEEEPNPVPAPGSRASPEEELTLIRADSELFAAVVREQLDGKDDEYPYRLTRFRFDSRPYGTPTGYPEVFSGVQGIDPTLTFARAGQSAIDELVDNRKKILDAGAVGEGGPLVYNQCAGAKVPEPPPVRGARRRTSVHAGCPKQAEYYITVGLPIRGQPEGLRGARDTKGRRVDLRGDVWTVLVTEFSAAPRGWSRAQYAWLFKRSRWNHRLELANTILVGVIE
jgi:hypothetical protein